jgi:hypothetical protein
VPSLKLRLRQDFSNLAVLHLRSSPLTVAFDFKALPSTLRELRLHRCCLGSIPEVRDSVTWGIDLRRVPRLEVLDLVDLYAGDGWSYESSVVRLFFRLIGRVPAGIRELRVVLQPECQDVDFGADEYDCYDEEDEDDYENSYGSGSVVLTKAHSSIEILDLQRVSVDFCERFWLAASKLRQLSLDTVRVRTCDFDEGYTPYVFNPPPLEFLRVVDANLPFELLEILQAAVTEPPSNACGTCGKPAENRCSICLVVYYCDHSCQRASWSTHKLTCKKPT